MSATSISTAAGLSDMLAQLIDDHVDHPVTQLAHVFRLEVEQGGIDVSWVPGYRAPASFSKALLGLIARLR